MTESPPAVSSPAPDSIAPSSSAPIPFHDDGPRGIQFFLGDSLEILAAFAAKHPDGFVDAVFADPPYFLSNNGITCQSGRMVSVNKAGWDRSRGADDNHAFNIAWLRECQRVLKPDGTIWVTGTHHVIFSVGFAMQQLGFKILNVITWEKPNPPPNLSCRYFTHSTEQVLWAAKSAKSRHTFHYPLMKELNGGRQMKAVWPILAPGRGEKAHGRHPTQKPLALVERCLSASTSEDDLVLDPFLGSGTTAVACAKLGRRCIGIESDRAHLETAVRRLPAPQLPLGDARQPARVIKRR
jgi:site-specific DNA-methyltransferase (adenine-specific)